MKLYKLGLIVFIGLMSVIMAIEANNLAFQEGFKNSAQIVAQLEDFNTSIYTKTSILATIGRRGDKTQLPIVRKYAKQDDNDALKSAAIGALGLIGDVTDMGVILKAISHKNHRIVIAAVNALNKINERNRAKVKHLQQKRTEK